MSIGNILRKGERKFFFDKELKLGKIQKYTFDVSSWLEDEKGIAAPDTLTNASAESVLGFCTVSPCQINQGFITFFATGVNLGNDIIRVSYATATQQDSDDLRLNVQKISWFLPEDNVNNFISDDGYLISDGYLLDDAYLLEGV